MNGVRDRFRRFMAGRYGTDELNRLLSALLLIFVALHLLTRQMIFFWMEVICLLLNYGRMFSRDADKRFKENQAYLCGRFYAGEWVRKLGVRAREGRKYKIFHCPSTSLHE